MEIALTVRNKQHPFKTANFFVHDGLNGPLGKLLKKHTIDDWSIGYYRAHVPGGLYETPSGTLVFKPGQPRNTVVRGHVFTLKEPDQFFSDADCIMTGSCESLRAAGYKRQTVLVDWVRPIEAHAYVYLGELSSLKRLRTGAAWFRRPEYYVKLWSTHPLLTPLEAQCLRLYFEDAPAAEIKKLIKRQDVYLFVARALEKLIDYPRPDELLKALTRAFENFSRASKIYAQLRTHKIRTIAAIKQALHDGRLEAVVGKSTYAKLLKGFAAPSLATLKTTDGRSSAQALRLRSKIFRYATHSILQRANLSDAELAETRYCSQRLLSLAKDCENRAHAQHD